MTPAVHLEDAASLLPSMVKRLAPGPLIVIVGAAAVISIGVRSYSSVIVCGVLKTVVLKLMTSVPPLRSACSTAQRKLPVAATPLVTVSSVLETVKVAKSWRSSSWTNSGYRPVRAAIPAA